MRMRACMRGLGEREVYPLLGPLVPGGTRGRRTVLYRGCGGAILRMQAGMHSRHAVLARATRITGKSDIKPRSKAALQAKYRGRKQLWHTRPKQNAANQESTAAQYRLIILSHLVVAEQVDAQRDCNLNRRTALAWHQSLACNSSHYRAARHKGRVRREMRRWAPLRPFAMWVMPTGHGVG